MVKELIIVISVMKEGEAHHLFVYILYKEPMRLHWYNNSKKSRLFSLGRGCIWYLDNKQFLIEIYKKEGVVKI